MTFDGGAVTQVSMSAEEAAKSARHPHHQGAARRRARPDDRGVSLCALRQPNGDPKVCDQTIPVFDGEARFNLILKPKRTVKLQKNASTGYSGFAAVCRVKFIPISGYRPDNPGIKLMSETNEIEVWLVSLPGTEMYVPYRIVLPTLVGYGYATSTSFQIQRGAKRASLD